MLWSPKKKYYLDSFEKEAELEKAVLEVSETLFGQSRVYLDIKAKIGVKNKTVNIPDGYLVDLSSSKNPVLFVVENELAKHDPLKHIAVQILQFSLSFETSPQKIKSLIKSALDKNSKAKQKCTEYAVDNGFENLDYLLETMLYKKDAFGALVIIDELPDELETVLVSKFKFPVEVITLQRYTTAEGEKIYKFDPFLEDIGSSQTNVGKDHLKKYHDYRTVDASEIDTIVVPAREDGFRDVFLGENCWHEIRIHGSMIPRIKYIAAYQVAPESAITHIAPVKSIEQWKETNKYVVIFSEPAQKIGPIKLVPQGKVTALQNIRYTSKEKLMKATTLDEAF